MTRVNEIYKCEICENIIDMFHPGAGELYCCGQPMVLKNENSEEVGAEKHLPVIKDDEKGKRITIGEVEHPMTDEHYIEWIEIFFADGRILRKNFKPGDEPSFYCPKDHKKDIIRAYCNVHGLWVKK
ncbi:desulfoferrodoxin FeS4 iron-binding domain-containing protein [Candidatus Parcubacteria bacterium]|nr:desulfoferrodoxin FeS4 iron-binding domain-containing protein [Candidatus Parcubacteria bacterium]